MRPLTRATFATVLVVTVAVGVGLWRRRAEGAAPAQAPPRLERKVLMDGTAFTPPEITVDAGTTIVWRNEDPFPHNVSSPSGAFESDDLASGGQFRLETRERGTFPYRCTLHSGMRGVIHVR